MFCSSCTSALTDFSFNFLFLTLICEQFFPYVKVQKIAYSRLYTMYNTYICIYFNYVFSSSLIGQITYSTILNDVAAKLWSKQLCYPNGSSHSLAPKERFWQLFRAYARGRGVNNTVKAIFFHYIIYWRKTSIYVYFL